MKAYYEKFQEESKDIRVYRNIPHVFPAHFHNNIEIFIVRKGKYSITSNNNEYSITDGCICIFDSYDIHSYNKQLDSQVDDCVLIIPNSFISPTISNKGTLLNPIIKNKDLCESVLCLIDQYLTENQSNQVKTSVVNLILTLIYEQVVYSNNNHKDETITLRKILSYIYDNFTSDITLKSLSLKLGYTPEHISRVFHKYIKMSIPLYVNMLRIEYVEKLKKQTNEKLSTYILESGFSSLQTYYRCKKAITNKIKATV